MVSKVVSVETRLAIAIARSVDPSVSVTRLCADLGISRQTFYQYERRFEKEGFSGLAPRSRAAKSHRNQTPVEMEMAVVHRHDELARQGLDAGARSVWGWMSRAGLGPPSARTIHRILARHGRVQVQPQKRPRSATRRFEAAQPNGCWQMDGMDWKLADDRPVKVIRALDDHSRKVFRSTVAVSESGDAARQCLLAAIGVHGRPAMVLTDNSLAFNGSRRGVEVQLQKTLRGLGIAQVASRARHPGTCGKAEREHQTLQRWLRAHPQAQTIEELQGLIDLYDDVYNSQRPHQALGGLDTPDERYQATAKAVATDHPLPAQKLRMRQVTVSRRGTVSAGSTPNGQHVEIHIGREWEGTVVSVARDGNHVAVFHHKTPIYSISIDPTRRYQPSGRPTGRPKGGSRRRRITST